MREAHNLRMKILHCQVIYFNTSFMIMIIMIKLISRYIWNSRHNINHNCNLCNDCLDLLFSMNMNDGLIGKLSVQFMIYECIALCCLFIRATFLFFKHIGKIYSFINLSQTKNEIIFWVHCVRKMVPTVMWCNRTFNRTGYNERRTCQLAHQKHKL